MLEYKEIAIERIGRNGMLAALNAAFWRQQLYDQS